MSRLPVLVVLLLLGHSAARAERRVELWWLDARVQQALHLTSAQVRALDRLFHDRLEQRIADRRRLADLERQFTASLTAGDHAAIEHSRLIERREDLRRRINVRRAVMLLAMYRMLSPDQRQLLSATDGPGRLAGP
jgi:Spy/CpxP family protein refolding chaperone